MTENRAVEEQNTARQMKNFGNLEKKVSFSLKTKMLLSLIGLVAFFCIVIVIVLHQRSSRFVEEQAVKDIDGSLAAFELLVGEEEKILGMAYQLISRYPGIAEAMAAGDHKQPPASCSTYTDYAQLRDNGIAMYNASVDHFFPGVRVHFADEDLSSEPILIS